MHVDGQVRKIKERSTYIDIILLKRGILRKENTYD